jgi:GDPmannose 4,6-dehydratase
MRAIIFGVTGQDGSHLADLLISKNYEVVGVARRSSVDTTERIKHLAGEERFELVQGDITDVSSVMNILSSNNEVDEVYNLAAQSHVGVSFKQPGLTWDITGKGVLNILQAIVDLRLHCRFYQASSSEMFGDSYDVNPDTGEKYQNEKTKFLPQSPYAIAKCAAHYAVRLYREAYGLHASAGILFNHEGERRGENFVTRKITKWIGNFIGWCESKKIEPSELIFDGEKMHIPTNCGEEGVGEEGLEFPKLRLGNLDACRDWGYAGDYVEAMWIMLQQEDPDDYVICTGNTYTIREFLERAFTYVGIEDWEKHVVIDPEFYRPAEVDYLRGSSEKARHKMGWTPKNDLDGLVNIMMKHDVHENIQSLS